MKITQFLHSAILVSNLEKSQYFYETILGLSPVERPFNFPGVWYQVGVFQIHLIQADQMISDRINNEKWGRNRHLAFAVENIEIAKQKLMTHHYEIQMSASGRPALFTQDPDGNLIELSQA